LDGLAHLGQKKKINEKIISQLHYQEDENNPRRKEKGAVVDMMQTFLNFFFFH
jgi:hypothetical protein